MSSLQCPTVEQNLSFHSMHYTAMKACHLRVLHQKKKVSNPAISITAEVGK